MSDVILPIVDVDVFLASPDSEASSTECKKVPCCFLVAFDKILKAAPHSQAADALITYGALLLHDSRVSKEDNNTFLDLIEDYFAQPGEALKKDERPELGYQGSPIPIRGSSSS